MRRIAVAAIASALACTGVVGAPRVASAVDAGAWHFNPATGHLYQEVYHVTWDEAEAYAVSVGGHLATINDRAEDEWLAATFTDQNLWIGFNDRAVEGTWVWASGEPVTYTNWCADQPDDWQQVGGEDHGWTNANYCGGTKWDDAGGGASNGIVELPRATLATRTVSGAWRAKIGSGGANGTATISAYTTGTGSLALKLAKLRANTYQPVTLSKGTCGSVGATLIRFPAIRTGSTGAAARTSSLTTSQVTAIRNATRGTGKIALRVGSSTTGGVKCGLFAALPVAPYVAARITVGWGPSDVAVAPNGVWVANWGSNSLSRIDPATNSVLQTVQLTLATQTAGPETLAYGEGSLWVTVTDWDAANNALAGSLLRIDPASGSQLATVPMGRGPIDVAVTPGAVWVAVGADNVVARVDPASNQLVASIPIQEPSGLAGTGDALWVVDRNGKLSRIDPATNQVTTTVQTQDSGGSIVFGGGSLWVTNPGHVGVADGSLTRVDPVSYAVTGKVDVGSHPEDVAFGGGSAWVGMFDDPLVVRVAAANNAVTARVAVGYDVYRLTATATSVWIAQPIEQAPGVVTRLGF